jgi:hypothetical protein
LIGIASFSIGWRGVAHAQPRTSVALDYDIALEASGCPDADRFRASVERQLGYDPFRAAADKRIAVQIAPKDGGFEGHIRWSDADGHSVGERRLSSRRPECKEIAASVAFAVAVQIQLLATLAPPAPEPPAPVPEPPAPPPAAPEPGAKVTVVERPIEPPAPEPEPAARSGALTLSVGLGPSLALGVSPEPTGLGRIFVSARRAWVSFELALDAAMPVTQHLADGTGFSLRRFAAGGAVCGHVRAFAGCALGIVGLLQARGVDLDVPRSPSGVFSQLGARVAATRDFGRYFLAVHVDGLVMSARWTVTLNQAAAWTTPRVGAVIGVDLGARFF